MQPVFATNNLNKLKEVQALIPKPIKLLSLDDILCIEDISESKSTLVDDQHALLITLNH